MDGYVFGVVGMFRLTRCALAGSNPPDEVARAAAWIAALIYAANPNLMYMQSTAMGETAYLAFFVWTGVYFCEWIRGNPAVLAKCGLCLAGASLTRYDGWFLAVATTLGVLLGFGKQVLANRGMAGLRVPVSNSPTTGGLAPNTVIRFFLISAAT